MWDMLAWFLKQPQGQWLLWKTTCASLLLQLKQPVVGLRPMEVFFLCTDLIRKVFFISRSYHSLPHQFLLTPLYLTEFMHLICSLFTSQFPVVCITALSCLTTQHLASSWDELLLLTFSTCWNGCLSLSFPVCYSLMGRIILTLLGNFPFRVSEGGEICLTQSNPVL